MVMIPQVAMMRVNHTRAPTRSRITFEGMYLIAYIDRQNVSYAKLQMVGDLGLSEAAYGFGGRKRST
jgi:sugar phosphate permease